MPLVVGFLSRRKPLSVYQPEDSSLFTLNSSLNAVSSPLMSIMIRAPEPSTSDSTSVRSK